jgi:glutaminase
MLDIQPFIEQVDIVKVESIFETKMSQKSSQFEDCIFITNCSQDITVTNLCLAKHSSVSSSSKTETSAIVLVPTKELCHQVEAALQKLLQYCSSIVTVTNLAWFVLMLCM